MPSFRTIFVRESRILYGFQWVYVWVCPGWIRKWTKKKRWWRRRRRQALLFEKHSRKKSEHIKKSAWLWVRKRTRASAQCAFSFTYLFLHFLSTSIHNAYTYTKNVHEKWIEGGKIRMYHLFTTKSLSLRSFYSQSLRSSTSLSWNTLLWVSHLCGAPILFFHFGWFALRIASKLAIAMLSLSFLFFLFLFIFTPPPFFRLVMVLLFLLFKMRISTFPCLIHQAHAHIVCEGTSVYTRTCIHGKTERLNINGICIRASPSLIPQSQISRCDILSYIYKKEIMYI